MSRVDRRAALVACVRDHPPAEPVPALDRHLAAGGAIEPLAALAVEHGVTGCLWTAVRAGGHTALPGAAELRARHAASVAAHLRTLSDVGYVDDVLTAAGLPYLAVKGPVLAEAVYRRPDLRDYVDLDLLVAPADFAAALVALEAAGCRLYERNWRLIHERMVAELRLFTPAGTVLDLHWHLVSEVRPRETVPLDMAGARARARSVDLGGRKVATLDPADTVVHLSLHAALSGANRLVWLKDVEQALLAADARGWAELADRARRWHAGPAVSVVLARVGGVLGLPVPAGLVRELAPERRWRAVARAVDRIAPIGRARVEGSIARMVARSSREDPAASRRELRARLLSRVRHPAGTHRDPFDAADPVSAAYADGGEAERSAYLSEVARLPG